jgi:hypothetical protein
MEYSEALMKASIKDKLLFILGGSFLVILVGLLIFNLTRRGIYNVKMGLNIAVVGDEGVNVLLIRPEEQMAGWVRMPKNIRIKVYNSEAHYPLNSIWKYGVSERMPFEVIEKSLGQSMGVVISRTVKLDGESSIENVLGRMFSIGLKTDLSLRDRALIRQFLADAVKSKKILEMVVPESVFEKVTDPDGAEFFEFNQAMSLWTKNKFVIEPILDENADISINNISGVSGLGNIYANQLESAGGHVIEVIAAPEQVVEGKGCVFSSAKRFEMTERVLREQIGCRRIALPDFVEDGDRISIWIK